MAFKISPELQKIQDEINQLHLGKVEALEKIVADRDMGKNAIFAERTKALKANKKLRAFWPGVIKRHNDLANEVLGPYDDQIFDAMEDFQVEYTKSGPRLEMTFRQNPFFTNKTLWAEEDQANEELKTSGIEWKEGMGPESEDDDDEEDGSAIPAGFAAEYKKQGVKPPTSSAVDKKASAGDKRGRDEKAETRGPSFFSFFAELPPEPTLDEEEAEEMDEEEMEDFDEDCEAWGEMVEEKMEIFRCLVNEIWEDPAGVLGGLYNNKQE